MADIIETIKKAAVDAVKASNICSVRIGKVISASPPEDPSGSEGHLHRKNVGAYPECH